MIDVQVARKLWTMTAGELRHAEDHMLLLGRKNAMERVANFLLEMDRRLAVAGMMALPMCRRDIGDYLGLTLETVSRALSQLHAKACSDFPAPVRSSCAIDSACVPWTLNIRHQAFLQSGARIMATTRFVTTRYRRIRAYLKTLIERFNLPHFPGSCCG